MRWRASAGSRRGCRIPGRSPCDPAPPWRQHDPASGRFLKGHEGMKERKTEERGPPNGTKLRFRDRRRSRIRSPLLSCDIRWRGGDFPNPPDPSCLRHFILPFIFMTYLRDVTKSAGIHDARIMVQAPAPSCEWVSSIDHNEDPRGRCSRLRANRGTAQLSGEGGGSRQG